MGDCGPWWAVGGSWALEVALGNREVRGRKRIAGGAECTTGLVIWIGKGGDLRLSALFNVVFFGGAIDRYSLRFVNKDSSRAFRS